MYVNDPNLHLGQPSSLAMVLFVAMALALGLFGLTVLARLSRVNVYVPLSILFVYSFVGVAAYFVLGPFSLSGDGPVYDAQAVQVASRFGQYIPAGEHFPLHQGKWGYPVLLGIVYSFAGRLPIAGVMLNAIVVGLTAIVVIVSARRLGASPNNGLILFVFFLYPSFITVGPAVMREALCWLSVALLSYALICIMQNQGVLLGSLGGSLAIINLLFVRTSFAILACLAAVLAIVLAHIYRRWGYVGVGSVVGGLLVLILLLGDLLVRISGYDSTYILANREYLADTATTGFSVITGPLAIFGATGVYLATIPNILIGPLPWELRPSPVWVWVLINTAFWWAAVVGVWKVRRHLNDRGVYIALVTFGLAMTLGLSVTLTNYGILSRMRAQPMIVALIVLSAFGSNLVDTHKEPEIENWSPDKRRTNT